MKIKMPLEVWVDVFAPIRRYQLVNRLNEIGSRSFAEIAMFFLHEYGQIKLRPLHFVGDDDDYYYNEKVAETEMPSNIKDFQLIEICAQEDQIDFSLMTTFFTHLQPILSNVNLWCNLNTHQFNWYDDMNEVPEFLNELLPSIDSFNSIHFYDDQCFDLIQEKCLDKFFAAKVISINYKIMKENLDRLSCDLFKLKSWELTKVLKKIKKECQEIEDKKAEEEIVAEIIEEIIEDEFKDEEIKDEEAKNEEIEDEEMEHEEIEDEEIEDEEIEDEEIEDEEIEDEEIEDEEMEDEEMEDEGIKVEENSEQKYDRIVWKPKMAILRKWLLFNGNDIDDNDINDDDKKVNVDFDQPRILYVDEIPSEMFRNEIDSISKEFMQSTKPTRFIACFEPGYMLEKEHRNFETIRLVNPTTNEQLSAKWVFIEKKDIFSLFGKEKSKHWFAILHSHPIVPDGEEHEDNMLLVEKMLEKMSKDKYKSDENKMEERFVYTTSRLINLYRKGRKYGDYYKYGWLRNRDMVDEDSDEEDESPEAKKKEEEETKEDEKKEEEEKKETKENENGE